LNRVRVQRRVADILEDFETLVFSDIHRLCVLFNGHHLNVQMCIFASDFEAFEEFVVINSIQGQTRGPDFIRSLPCSLQKHNLEFFKFVGIITDYASYLFGSKMV